MNMDMKISGTGKIPEGQYNKISMSGSGRLFGNVHCTSFSSSGKSKGESIICSEKFKTSGSCRFSNGIKAKSIHSSGTLSCGGSITAEKDIFCSGSLKCEKNIKCEALDIAGSFTSFGDVEAEQIKVKGILNCKGLVNAENIELQIDKSMNIGSIGGSNISIKRKRVSIFIKRRLTVDASIEGDNVSVEHVKCPRITGACVIIGKGCEIDLVQYGEKIEISKNAKIGKIEKI